MSAMKNVEEMRKILAEQVDTLCNTDEDAKEKSSPAKVNAVSSACRTILSACGMQLSYARLHGKKKKIAFLE
jgi:uncharacterized protein (UPF0262 family)